MKNKKSIFNKHNLIKIFISFLLGFIYRYFFTENLFFELINDISFAYILTYFKIIDFSILNLVNNNNLLKESIKNSELKFQDKLKCKIYWILFEENKDKYLDYKSFKNKWDINTNLSDKLSKDISKEYKDITYKWWLRKKTLLWFLGKRS